MQLLLLKWFDCRRRMMFWKKNKIHFSQKLLEKVILRTCEFFRSVIVQNHQNTHYLQFFSCSCLIMLLFVIHCKYYILRASYVLEITLLTAIPHFSTFPSLFWWFNQKLVPHFTMERLQLSKSN